MMASGPSLSYDESTSEQSTPRSNTTTPFFADATLDLEEAHDIAETPEATRPKFDATAAMSRRGLALLDVPVLGGGVGGGGQDDHNNSTNNNESNTSSQAALPRTSSNTPTVATSNKTSFSRITSLETGTGNVTSSHNHNNSNNHHNSTKRPTWPRDVSWAVAFWLFIPVSFIWPILIEKHDQDVSPLIHHPLSTATLHTLWWAAVATFFISRLLYRTPSGGDGDDERHRVGQILTAAAPISVAVYACAAVMIVWACPNARAAALIPIWYLVRDVYLFRRWKRRSQQAGSESRQAFFQAISEMALDILSRSLRRASFYRTLSAILAVQLAVLILWRWALLGALGSDSWVVLLVALVGGKWATGTVARLLSLLACGGITSWFAQQTALLQELPQVPATQTTTQEDDDGYEDGGSGGGPMSIPEAYRTVDASVYQSVLAMDEGLDDDYELDDDEFMEAPSRREQVRREAQHEVQRSTVKSILSAGLSVSFGSVAQCGLVGGPAQFIWSQVRKVEAAQSVISQARADGGFQGMRIGNDDTSLLSKLWNRINMIARGFVRSYSDLAMSHVAAYYKSYKKAARDVATLIDESGVEPILHDDITTHMCACVGGSVSGIIVIFTGYVLLHQRDGASEDISDWEVVQNMLLAFVISYTLIFTVMEPLRASIKCCYVSFAEHPRSLSQAFPLIFHRLSRLSESNVS